MGRTSPARAKARVFRNFNTDAFARPGLRDFGDACVNILRGPGIHNWDINLGKRIPLFSEARFLQFRTELFNAWNHTQFSGLFTTARFDATGKQTDTNFGAYSAARSPRIITFPEGSILTDRRVHYVPSLASRHSARNRSVRRARL